MTAPRTSGLYARLVLLIGGVAVLILVAALLVLRRNAADAAQDQVVRNLHAQVVLADLLIDTGAMADARLGELGIRREASVPASNRLRARFWNGVVADLGAQLPGRDIRFVASTDARVWVRATGGQHGWIGIPVSPLRVEMRRSVIITILVAGVIVLVAAAAYARGLTRPLRQLADAAPEIAAGRNATPLPAHAAREFRELEAALNAAADSVRDSAADRSLMLAALSHDMRTPLARLRLASELAAMDESTRDGMHQDIEELDRLIGQCIDFARDGRDEPIERFDIAGMLGELAEAQQRGGHQWRVEVPAHAIVSARPMALRRAVGNLMENAQQHGHDPFEVRCAWVEGALSVAVLDRGPGVDPALLGKLGTPFLQATTSRQAGRSGLGLASALRVARQHGGSIRFANRDGGGFSAELTIPVSARSGS